MSSRFIKCSACKGVHTGRGGQFCKFLVPTTPATQTAGTASMATSGAAVPDRDTPECEAYLAEKIAEEEDRFKDKCRVASMEEQLARLRLQNAELQGAHVDGYLGHDESFKVCHRVRH